MSELDDSRSTKIQKNVLINLSNELYNKLVECTRSFIIKRTDIFMGKDIMDLYLLILNSYIGSLKCHLMEIANYHEEVLPMTLTLMENIKMAITSIEKFKITDYSTEKESMN
jgi:hypothetical protein